MRPLVYLDNAATTPIRPEVLEAMAPYVSGGAFGNPSSAHRFGREARAAVQEARRKIATALGAEPGQVFFMSGGTEANNLAVVGAALAARAAGRPFRVAVSAIEHKAVHGAAHAVEALGGEMVVLPVDRQGQVDLDALDAALEKGVAVVSVMWVNNEVGIVQDIRGIAERCAAAGTPFHTDAVQAVGKVPVSLSDAPCTMLTLSGHKLGAPKGIGALVLRDRKCVHPLLHGGGQQGGIRPGTENVSGAVGLGRAVELAVSELDEFQRSVGSLRERFERGVTRAVSDLEVTGANAPRAPHVCNVTVPGTDSEAMLMHLDLAGIACSSGSACSTGSVEPSHVLTALEVPFDRAIAALRFSFWKHTTAEDVDYVVEQLPGIVSKVRSLAGVLRR
ncbi:MAG TPA: cysteine desulfurase family protein [Gemmatimonadales bacterium]|nr:cysteine desulfurase family protein [Gemmatimonadales bacterium]